MSDDADLPKKLERLKHTYGLEYEMIRATAAFEHATLRPLFILNGGALVAYLALLGAGRIDFPIGRVAVLAWAIGLIAAAVAAFLGALSQFAYRKHRGQEVSRQEILLGMREGSAEDVARTSGVYAGQGECRRTAAIWAGVASIVLFVAGFWPAFMSIKQG